MDAITFLKAQHREIEALFEVLRSDLPQRDCRLAFARLADLLLCHAAVEEGRFYRAALSAETERHLHTALEDHLEIRLCLAELLELSVDHPRFKSGIARVEAMIGEHVAKEEQVLLPQVARAMGPELLTSLGEVLERDYQELVTEFRERPSVLGPEVPLTD